MNSRTLSLFALFALFALGCETETTTEGPEAAASTFGTDPNGGQILETMDAAGYTYMRLATSEGEKWAAVPEATLAVGSQVHLEQVSVMTGFESKTLGRTFDTILFGTLAAGAAASTPAMGGAHGAASASPEVKEVKKAEGEDARSVGEVYLQQDDLKDDSVTVRGEVVKYNAGILGKNWLHLQDGSGSSADGTHDLTVTTLDEATVGEIVTISGKVKTDADFGMGYQYVVIVEEAKVSR